MLPTPLAKRSLLLRNNPFFIAVQSHRLDDLRQAVLLRLPLQREKLLRVDLLPARGKEVHFV